MDAPTYQVVGLGGGYNLKVIHPPEGTTFIGATHLHVKTVAAIQVPLDITSRVAFQFGNPVAKVHGGKPLVLDKSTIEYKFVFYYASNSKVPGSPIPRAGQVSPRPL
jgi:hypothetical protein